MQKKVSTTDSKSGVSLAKHLVCNMARGDGSSECPPNCSVQSVSFSADYTVQPIFLKRFFRQFLQSSFKVNSSAKNGGCFLMMFSWGQKDRESWWCISISRRMHDAWSSNQRKQPHTKRNAYLCWIVF